MNAEPIIEMRDVIVPSRRDSETATIEGINWTVREREFWIVGGMQGSGKSDLIFMLAGLTKPLSGSYTLYGQDMTQHFGDEFLPCRLRFGVVFDDARLLNHLTIAENVALPARYHHDLHASETEEWVNVLLRTTDVAEFASNTPGLVSLAWRRRAALARALALRPELLLLENPLRGLDARHAAWWIEFVKKLSRGHDLMRGRALTVIVTTDGFRPWQEAGAKFATLDNQRFVLAEDGVPFDEVRSSKAVVGEEI